MTKPTTISSGKPRTTHPLSGKPGHLLRRAQQRSAAIYSEEAQEFGITGAQHVILVALDHYPGVDQNTLADIVDLDRWTTSDVVTRLERAGLVIRTTNPKDRRGRLVFLLPAGKAMIEKMVPAVERTQLRIMAPLSKAEQREFLRLIRKMVRIEHSLE